MWDGCRVLLVDAEILSRQEHGVPLGCFGCKRVIGWALRHGPQGEEEFMEKFAVCVGMCENGIVGLAIWGSVSECAGTGSIWRSGRTEVKEEKTPVDGGMLLTYVWRPFYCFGFLPVKMFLVFHLLHFSSCLIFFYSSIALDSHKPLVLWTLHKHVSRIQHVYDISHRQREAQVFKETVFQIQAQ